MAGAADPVRSGSFSRRSTRSNSAAHIGLSEKHMRARAASVSIKARARHEERPPWHNAAGSTYLGK